MAYALEKSILAAVTAFGIWALLPGKADAQGVPPCAPAAKFIADLAEKYDEVKIGGGIVSGNTVVGIFSSPNGDTWTILTFTPDGRACGLAAGEHLVLHPIPVEVPGVPS